MAPNTAGLENMTVQVSKGDVSEADIAAFRNNVKGDQFRHMDAGRHDMNARGIFSEQAPAQYQTEQPPIEQPLYTEDVPAPADQAADSAYWRQRYGQSENDKGEWRRMAQTYESQFTQLQGQIADLQSRAAVAPQPAYYGPPPVQQPPQPYNLFPQRDADDAPTVAEINDAITRFAYGEVVPALRDVQARAEQSAYQRSMADSQRRFGGWDVTPQEEQGIRGKFPWLAGLTPTDANQFILEHSHALRGSQLANQMPTPGVRPQPTLVGHVSGQQVQQPAPQPPIMVDPRTVMRRATYIESAPPAQITSDPGTQMSPTEAYQREMSAADAAARQAGQSRATAKTQRELMIKHFPNMPVGGDFGSGVLPAQ